MTLSQFDTVSNSHMPFLRYTILRYTEYFWDTYQCPTRSCCMGENFQKSELPTLLQFVRVRVAHQPHVKILTMQRLFGKNTWLEGIRSN